MSSFITSPVDYIVVVKKTLRYSNVFFYNHLYRTSVFRNIIMESGINIISGTIGQTLELTSRDFYNHLKLYSLLILRIISTWWERMNCLIYRLSKLYTNSVGMVGLLISNFFTPSDNRAVVFWGGFKGLGIKFDVYFCSRFEGHF